MKDAQQFTNGVFDLAAKIEDVLDGNDLLQSLAALSLVIGSALSMDVVGEVEGIDTLEIGMELVTGGIVAAYKNTERSKREKVLQ